MNAPLKKQPDWRKECLLAANQQLENQYLHYPSACLALQISRNYRLLLTQNDQPTTKQNWQSLSKQWWQMYCDHRSGDKRPIVNS
ncbi:hypothetical protein [Methylophaga sp.]|uniref:hypothetical protein n=1 Tax=Methylophaga sp. TaxID=2024840 RepID=UPI003F699459